VDETAQEKRGSNTTGASIQYAGCAGRTVNCTTWVAMSLILPETKTWVSNQIFLPKKTWFTGDGATGTARRARAGVPEDIEFSSKPELARQQYQHIREIGVAFNWGGGDEVYGRYKALREDHEEHGEAYAYFVPRSHVITTMTGERKRVDELLKLAGGRYELRSADPGINGPRYYDWAMIEAGSPNHFLLIRKPVPAEPDGQGPPGQESAPPGAPTAPENASSPSGKSPGKGESPNQQDKGITFCLCYVPGQSPIRPTMRNLVHMAGRRWGVEEAIAIGKGPIGWDENQFRKWGSLQHHTALAGLAMLKANVLRERLNGIMARASEASGARELGDQHTLAEITLAGAPAPPGGLRRQRSSDTAWRLSRSKIF